MSQSVIRTPDVIHFNMDFFCFSPLRPETILKTSASGDIMLASLCAQPDKKFIIKRFSLLKEERLARNKMAFSVEAKFMQSLDHPFLIKCIYAAKCPTYLSICMKYYSRGTLGGYLGNLTQESTELCAIQVACALRYLHNHNLVHLDVKLSNIFIDEEFNAILGDFGLANEMELEQTTLAKRYIGGTPGYLAPEYITATNEDELDPYKLDSYSLGVVLWCLVFERDCDLHVNFLSETRRRLDLLPSIKLMLLKLLLRDAAKRFTVADVLSRVRRGSIHRHFIDRN